jgi:23S rRNA (adenine2503-C2)-methyltransferase
MEDIRDLIRPLLAERLGSLGIEPYRAGQIFEWLYKKGVSDFSLMTNLSREVRAKLAEAFVFDTPAVEEIATAGDLTQKFLLRLKDGALIEAVSVPFKSWLTACLSSQVGCRFRCPFCASGAEGFGRDLAVHEILAQYLAIRDHVPEHRISNVVFMGIGEPLDNYEAVLKAIRILNDPLGVRLGIRKITVSTSGIAPAIERMASEGLQIELSISLHAANDEKRDALVPVNRKYPLKVLMAAVRKYIQATKRKVTFEYVLLGGVNTAVEDAQGVLRLLRGLDSRVNLIPYNATAAQGVFQPPSKLEVLFFKNYLSKAGVDVTLRLPRGTDIVAACGQLRARALQKKGERKR